MDIIKLTFIESDGMPDQYIHPYDTDMRGHHVDLFKKTTQSGRDTSFGTLARVAGSILTPSSQRKILSNIDNGWDAKRIIFAMVVRTGKFTQSEDYHYIVGHTDEAAYTTQGRRVKFENNMKMYFDSITKVHLGQASFRGNKIYQPSLKSHDEILNRSTIQGHRRSTSLDLGAAVTTRPTDLFRRGQGNGAFSDFLSNRDLNTTNLLGHFAGQLKTNNRINNTSTGFLSRATKAHVAAATDPGDSFIGDHDDEEVLTRAQKDLYENDLEDDPYFMELQRDTNILQSGYVTFGELMSMNPDFDEDRQLPFTPLNVSKKYRTQNAAGWRGTDNETIAAIIIANTLPGLMLNAMYSSLDGLLINTRARMGEPKVLVTQPWPYVEGLKVTSSLQYFENMLEQVLLPEITKNGMFDIEATIDANVDDLVKIWIRVDGGEEAYFEYPAWGSALLAPTLDNSAENLDHLSKKLIDLTSDVSRSHMKSNPSHTEEKPSIVTGLDLSSARDERDSRRRPENDDTRVRASKNW